MNWFYIHCNSFFEWGNSHQNKSITDEEAGEGASTLTNLCRDTCLTWGRVFLFSCSTASHSVQNGVSKTRGHMGETALHGNIAPPFLPAAPCRGLSTSVCIRRRQAWAERLWKHFHAKAVFVPLEVKRTEMLSIQWCRPNHSPWTNPRVPRWSMRRWTGFEKNGSKYPFEVIWIDPKWGRVFSLFLAKS